LRVACPVSVEDACKWSIMNIMVFWHVCFYDDVLQCVCLVRCVWIHTLGYASFFVQWFLCQSVDKHITKQPGAYFRTQQLASFQFTGRCAGAPA
jgi:hypothetical protein